MPETKIGKCPWCERYKVLYFAMGQYDGNLWCDWICAKCLNAARELKKNESDNDLQSRRT